MNTRTFLGIALSMLTLPALAHADHWNRREYRHPYSCSYRPESHPSLYSWGGYSRGDTLERGYDSGRLSRSELRELQERRGEIRSEEAAYLADGRLSRSERHDLQDDWQDYNQLLHHELNDGERRW